MFAHMKAIYIKQCFHGASSTGLIVSLSVLPGSLHSLGGNSPCALGGPC